MVWPSSGDWASDLRRYISGLITASVARQLQQLGHCGSRGGLVVQAAVVKAVMDLHLPPVTSWLRRRARYSLLDTCGHKLLFLKKEKINKADWFCGWKALHKCKSFKGRMLNFTLPLLSFFKSIFMKGNVSHPLFISYLTSLSDVLSLLALQLWLFFFFHQRQGGHSPSSSPPGLPLLSLRLIPSWVMSPEERQTAVPRPSHHNYHPCFYHRDSSKLITED